jgi:hypothetical protein
VTDLGTEFGVEVSKDGSTQSHVFRGSVKVQYLSAGGKLEGIEQVLRENQSAQIGGHGNEKKIVTVPAVRFADFMPAVSKRSVKLLDLVDVVAGGDGFSGRRERGIDPNSGRVITALPTLLSGQTPWELVVTPSLDTANLLRGKTATASSEYSVFGAPYRASNAVNGAAALFNDTTDWVSEYGDATPRLTVAGIGSAIRTIRIWGYTDIPIRSITIRASAVAGRSSLTSSDYEMLLVPTTTYDGTMSDWHRVSGGALQCYYYKDYAVNAPEGTQSLLFEFTGGQKDKRVRVLEVQAFREPIPARGINVNTANREYHRIRTMPFIDGVFVPHGTTAQTTSTGCVFDGFEATSAEPPFFLWAFGQKSPSGPRTTFGGIDYASRGHGMLFMPANQGITFDLNAIRSSHSGWRVARFRAVGGNAEQGEGNSDVRTASLWVLVDGRVRHKQREINGWSGMNPITFSIQPNDRFLTLVATDAGNGSAMDWIVFGDPILELVPVQVGPSRRIER